MTLANRSFRVAQIVYFADIGRQDALVIPLGSLAEIVLPHIRGLALKARAQLNEDEVAVVSPLLRARFASPFAYLKTEFDDAWNGSRDLGGSALDILTRRHTTSLSILSPTAYCNAQKILMLELPARDDAVVANLSAAINHEYDALQERFHATSDGTESAYLEDERKLAA